MTAVLALLDVAGGPGPGALRAAGGTVFGPVERVVSLSAAPRHGDGASSEALRSALAVGAQRTTAERAAALALLLDSPQTSGRSFVPARVVAVGRSGAAGPERVTVDVGSRDGIRAQQVVVDADGLVGRVVTVSPWTSDVLLVGAPDLVATVRVGARGTLGSVGPATEGARPRAPGQLALTLVQRGSVSDGQVVTTVGGAGSVFPGGLRVGTVSAVDRVAQGLTATGAVTPAVDVTTLDVVGVLVGGERSDPRPTVTGGAR